MESAIGRQFRNECDRQPLFYSLNSEPATRQESERQPLYFHFDREPAIRQENVATTVMVSAF